VNCGVLSRKDKSESQVQAETGITDPRGLCYCDDSVWTAVDHRYAVYCVNYAVTFVVSAALDLVMQ
jgi:hypothetical protein